MILATKNKRNKRGIHMKLWGGRFTKEENQLVHNFNESLSFDQKFYAQDIRGSIAHVKMLGKQNIISEDEMNQIIKGLEGIKNDIDNGNLVFTKESEDIHSFVEMPARNFIQDVAVMIRLHLI